MLTIVGLADAGCKFAAKDVALPLLLHPEGPSPSWGWDMAAVTRGHGWPCQLVKGNLFQYVNVLSWHCWGTWAQSVILPTRAQVGPS